MPVLQCSMAPFACTFQHEQYKFGHKHCFSLLHIVCVLLIVDSQDRPSKQEKCDMANRLSLTVQCAILNSAKVDMHWSVCPCVGSFPSHMPHRRQPQCHRSQPICWVTRTEWWAATSRTHASFRFPEPYGEALGHRSRQLHKNVR